MVLENEKNGNGLSFASSVENTEKDGSCADGYRLCPELPESASDNLQICVSSKINCPVNDIVISNRNPTAFIYKKGPSLGEDLNVYYTHRTNKRPLAEFRLSEDSVCYKNDQTNISQGRKDSIFLKKQRKRCDLEE